MLQRATREVFISFDVQWTAHEDDEFNLGVACDNSKKHFIYLSLCPDLSLIVSAH